MASSKIKMVAEIAKSSAQLKDSWEKAGFRYEQAQEIDNFLRGLIAGTQSAILSVEIGDAPGDGTAASGVITISGSGAQSVTINGGALTGGTDYDIANLSASEIAENLASAIAESSSSRVQSVMAEVSGATVILKSKSGGEVGNLVTLAATGDAAASVSNLEGGSDDGQDVYKFNGKS